MAELLAKDIMTKKVITISKDATLAELANLLMKNKISGVPVIDEEKRLIGVATEADIIVKKSSLPLPLSFSFAFLDKYENYTKSTKDFLNIRVEEIMSEDLKTTSEDITVNKVVNTMINNNINRLPVLNSNNKLVGIITRADIMKCMVKESKK